MALISLAFAGCKKNTISYPNNSSSIGNVLSETSEADSSKTVTNNYQRKAVNLLVWDENTEATAKGEWIRTRQKLFSEKYPEIKFTRIITPTQAGDAAGDRVAFTTAIAAGTAPDVYQAGHFSVMPLWIANGFAEPLDKYLATWEDYKSISKSALKGATWNSKVYGVPEYLSVMCLAYNKSLYRAAGINPDTPPATWDELRQNAVKLTKSDKSQYGLALIGNSTADWWFQTFVWQAGGELTNFNQDGTVSVHYTDSAVKTALKYYYDLRWVYNVLQPDFSVTVNTLQRDFASGKCAQIIYSSQFYETMISMGMDDENLGLATLPTGPSGKKVTANGGAYWFINSQASEDEKAAAFEYIKFMSSKEAMIDYYQTLESYGSRNPVFSFYDDIDPADYIHFNQTWINVFEKARSSSREETALVESFRPYVNQVVESVLIDKNANLDALLSTAQKDAVNDIADPYNAKIKK